MSVISVLNLKGGVGKTSTCHHLAGCYAKQGRSVLLIDNDPQASLTQGFWGSIATEAIEPRLTVAALYDPEATPMAAALIRSTGFTGISLVPGSPALADLNMVARADWHESQMGLRDFVNDVREDYDYVFIDNPPNLYLGAQASLVASDYLLVPLQPEDYGAQGIGPVLHAARQAVVTSNPWLTVLGLLLTMFDKRLAIHSTVETVLRETYGDRVCTQTWPAAKDFKEAVGKRQPISHYKPKGAPAKAVQAIAAELDNRIAQHRGAGKVAS
jgi:chromosome partitioning protein